MEDYYEYLDSNGVTTLYKLIKDDTVALIDSYSVTLNGITTTLDTHINDSDIHTPIATIEGMIDTAIGSLDYATPDYVDTKISGLVNSAPETLDTLKELSDALGNDANFATTVVNQIGNKADKDTVYTKLETDTLLEDKANKSDLSTVATSGSYKDLLDKPVIPEGADLSDYYNKGETDNLLNSKANTSDLAVVAKSGNYNDLINTPTIPTKTSDLTNDSGYITGVAWGDITSKPSFSDIAISGSYNDLVDTPTIPTKTSQLINDSGFLTSSSGVITSVSWSDITNKPNFSTVATSGSYNDLSNKPTIPKVYNKTLTIQKNGTNVATFTSNSNTDVTADITVPTKVSELSNDSGFITGISWDKVTNKPTLAKVATSGSYTDLSNTPTIPTKVSQLENDTGFINTLTGVVDTKSNQTINGTKTFTVGPVASNYATTNGYFIKVNAIARNEVPTQLYHATFRANDKNGKILGEYCIEKSNSGSTLAQINVRSEDANGKQISRSIYFNMSNDGTKTSFYPNVTNNIDLGMSQYKWAKVYSDDVVHTSGDETIGGIKTFNDILKVAQGTLQVGSDAGYSVTYSWSGNIVSKQPSGTFNISLPKANGTLALDDNVVHRTGNETISGFKSFTEVLDRRNDVTISTVATVTQLVDTNANRCGWIANRMHWAGNYHVHNRHIAYNENSGKEVYIDIISSNNGSGGLFVGGSATNRNLNDVTSATDYTVLATMGWVNNPATSTNVVHRSGDETIYGNKFFIQDVYATTPATTDNSTRIATTAWVRNYVNSVGGSNTVGSSVSAYWSNSSNVTATGQASSGGYYPACYSDYVSKTPTVGTIYSGAQLYTVLNTSASATGSTTGSSSGYIYYTNNKAQATFSNPISSTGKYLCTTANTVKFRAHTATGSSSAVGASSVVNATLTKSIFIRVE